MNRFCHIILSVSLLILCGEHNANAQLSRLKFGEYKITGITPRSFRSVDGTAQFVCTNDSLSFTMSNIQGMVYKKGREFVTGRANPVSVPHGRSTIVVEGNASLCPGISFWDVLACIAFRAEDYTIDVSMTITNSRGDSRRFTKQGMSVANLLHNVRGR